MTLELLTDVLFHCWIKDTAYKTDQANWRETNKALGQCTVTSMIVYDFFGGKIIRGFSEKYNIYHYWNEINGEKIDLTFSQFLEGKGDIQFERIVQKEKDDLLKISNVKHRYELLTNRVFDYMKKNHID